MASVSPPVPSRTILQYVETQPSDLERWATRNFIDSGLNSNRFFAVWNAIPAIAASSIMIVGNPLNGILKGSVVFLQGDFSKGTVEGVVGVFNGVRSLYNVLRVASTALLGLAFRETMYSAMVPQSTDAEILNRKVENLSAQKDQLEGEVQDLEGRAQLVSDFPGILGRSIDQVRADLSAKIGGIGDPRLTEPYKQLEALFNEKLEELRVLREVQIPEAQREHAEVLQGLKERLEAQIRDAQDPEMNGLSKRVKELASEHSEQVEKLQRAQAEQLRAVEEKALKAQRSLEDSGAEIERLKTEHRRANEEQAARHQKELEDARNPEMNGTKEKIDGLTRTHEEQVERLKVSHQEALEALERQVRELGTAKEEIAAKLAKAEEKIGQLQEAAQGAERAQKALQAQIGESTEKLAELEQLAWMIGNITKVTADTHKETKFESVIALRKFIVSYREFLTLTTTPRDQLKGVKVEITSPTFTFLKFVVDLQDHAATQEKLAGSSKSRLESLQDSFEKMKADRDRKDKGYQEEKERADGLEDKSAKLVAEIMRLNPDADIQKIVGDQ